MKLMAIILMSSLSQTSQTPNSPLSLSLSLYPTQFNSTAISKEARSMKTIDARSNEKKGQGLEWSGGGVETNCDKDK